MSTNASNLFAFDRALPSPFDTLKSKRLSVSSKYGDGTASTLCASVIKGIHAVFRCMDHSGPSRRGRLSFSTAKIWSSAAVRSVTFRPECRNKYGMQTPL